MQRSPAVAAAVMIWSMIGEGGAAAAPEASFSARLLGEHVGAWEKSDTELNPDGAVIAPGLQDWRAALQAKPSLAWGPATAKAEAWALLGNDGRGHEDILLSEAVAGITHAGVQASGGMKRFFWGSAYSWNPSNPFGDRDANNVDRLPAYRRRGMPFLQAEQTGASHALRILALDGEGEWADDSGEDPLAEAAGRAGHFFAHADYALRGEYYLDRADVGLTLARYREEPFAGFSVSSTLSDAFAAHAEASWLGAYGIRLPSAVATPAGPGWTLAETQREHAVQAALGGQYTTPAQINLLLEYLYNGAGHSRDDVNRLRAAARDAEAGLAGPLAALHAGFLGGANALPGFFRRHYAFARVAFQELPRGMKATVFTRWCLEEAGDAMLGGSFSLPLPANLDFRTYGEWFPESEGTETGLIPIGFYASTALVLTF